MRLHGSWRRTRGVYHNVYNTGGNIPDPNGCLDWILILVPIGFLAIIVLWGG